MEGAGRVGEQREQNSEQFDAVSVVGFVLEIVGGIDDADSTGA